MVPMKMVKNLKTGDHQMGNFIILTFPVFVQMRTMHF